MAVKLQIIPVTPLEQNCALLWNDETLQGAVIDPGGDIPRIIAAAEKTGVTIADIFLTHGHMDHAGGAAELAAKLKLRVTGPHQADAFLLASMAQQGKQFGLTAQNCTPDAWLKDGDTITIGGHAFAVLHCPGHTPGHVVFVNHAEKFGIFGDVLFRNSVGRTDFPYGDHDALISAIKTKLLPLGDDYNFICGHGPPSGIGAERRSNPFIQ